MSLETVNVAALIAAVACLLLLAIIWRVRRRMVIAVLLLPALALGIGAGYFFWYGHRPLPANTRETLFPGVEYRREARSTPRPLVIHVVTVDLATPGLDFMVTPGVAGADLPARTVSRFLDEFNLQIAINGGFFEPWWDRAPWDYYPHEGDPVRPLRGWYAADGVVYQEDAEWTDTVYISHDNQISFGAPVGAVHDALSGFQMLAYRGEDVFAAFGLPDEELHPRTAIGLDATAQTFFIMIVDGRQPNYSEGVTLRELTDLMREFGAVSALNMDGGGSSTLVVEGAAGQPVVLNSPIHGRVPGRERPVATHLGISISSGS